MKKLLVSIAAAVALVGVTLPLNAGAITNGQIDTITDYVGAMRGVDPGGTERVCSGSLISEGVFLTAGHCAVLTGVTIEFGDVLGSGAPDNLTFSANDVLAHPSIANNFGFQYDVGLVLFDQGTVMLATGSLAMENYIDSFTRTELKAETFTAVGYGLVRNDTNGNSSPLTVMPERRAATQTFLNMHNQYLGLSIHTNKGNGGGCFGDSGGPHLLNGYIVSVTSNGDANCVATDNTQRVDQPEIRDWIESYTS